jgi:DNA-directed RNA polymerase subunit RPC12/RpoP
MKMKCLSCGREMILDQQVSSDFKGSIKCFSCSAAMEIQTMRGVLIWGYPLSGMNPDYAERTAERDLQGEQDMLTVLQRKIGSQNNR